MWPASVRSRSARSGRKTINPPCLVRLFEIAEAVVEPAGTSLPEFDAGRGKNITAPVRGHRHILAGIFGFQLFPLLLKKRTVFDWLALPRSPRSQPAAPRASFVIRLRLFSGQLGCSSCDANLSFLISPIKDKSCMRVVREQI